MLNFYKYYCDAQYISMYCLNSFVAFKLIIFHLDKMVLSFNICHLPVIGYNVKMIIGLLVSARIVISVHP